MEHWRQISGPQPTGQATLQTIFGTAGGNWPRVAMSLYQDYGREEGVRVAVQRKEDANCPWYECNVDHASLLDQLRRLYPDGWALSTSSAALFKVWSLCPEARLCVWVRACRVVKARQALSGYECLLVAGGRPRRVAVAEDLRDVLVYRGRHRAFPGAIVGMKPVAFAEWMFRLLGAQAGDELVDLFPGSGAISEAWKRYAAGGSDTSADQQPMEGGGE